ncbi:ATP phosphoribosyltransferase [Microbispora triticiradicis]|uniref:ATP phosphoribosyltransferase n=3 Tax=Microbispora TaxID=2005 RepID=A0ABY3LR20_9ACTN|nr:MULTISPECIES: ATP phosphoribosyltransferase [Microbispora]RGA01207.1 ATP phosphoribosyltransferase [Microbispora triticiradicis]TLP54811.1 ATP phosphoribosyltransferase [Microbispora fusca]TYB50736.1 ATP phosphoribosyltransferase [Microbispora tritici]GLW22596.1 ATP phosphoribosyltransferase [Microbispora amethystogenes]
MISLALPKGSLERRALQLFEAAGLRVRRSSESSYRGTIDYGNMTRVAFYKPREIPSLIESGSFDLGLTGADWVEESGAKVEVVEAFDYSRHSEKPWRLVLAVPTDHAATCVTDLVDGVRVATEYPNTSRRFLEAAGRRAEVVVSYGVTEAKIPELADAMVDVVETGHSLRQNNLRVIETIKTCGAQLIANPVAYEDKGKRDVIRNVARLLRAAWVGPAHVLLTVRVPAERLPEAALAMPADSWRAGSSLADENTVVLQGVLQKRDVPATIGALLSAGALDVTESGVGMLASDTARA